MAEQKNQRRAQAEAEGDAVAARAIDVGRRRAAPGEDVTIAETRGVYRDAQGRRRVVGAGQAVPRNADGAAWERVEDAPLEGRAEGLAVRGGAEGNAGEPTEAGTGGGASK